MRYLAPQKARSAWRPVSDPCFIWEKGRRGGSGWGGWEEGRRLRIALLIGHCRAIPLAMRANCSLPQTRQGRACNDMIGIGKNPCGASAAAKRGWAAAMVGALAVPVAMPAALGDLRVRKVPHAMSAAKSLILNPRVGILDLEGRTQGVPPLRRSFGKGSDK
jgi:hypothetical protein